MSFMQQDAVVQWSDFCNVSPLCSFDALYMPLSNNQKGQGQPILVFNKYCPVISFLVKVAIKVYMKRINYVKQA